MNEVYINIKDFGELFIGKFLTNKHNKDLITIDELIGDIEDLISENQHLEERIEELEEIRGE